MSDRTLIIKKDNRDITDVKTWFNYAEPKGGSKQWKVGRSAYEFARYMTAYNGEIPSAIKEYLLSIGIKSDRFMCEPEKVTSFQKKFIQKCGLDWDLGRGEGRHHDGLMTSVNSGEIPECVIGIEAKVSEPFDKPIKEKIEAAKSKKNNGENTRKRILESVRVIMNEEEKRDIESLPDLKYQLLSTTIGTVLEARKAHASKAVVLIMEFVGNVHKESRYAENVNRNGRDYSEFLAFLGKKAKTDIDTYAEIAGIKVWFKKLKINIGKPEYSVE